MRISLNLSRFFEDHRSLAKIFINKSLKCIKDVENHVTNIFGIRNFYLKCENHYLPEAEDVHVLNDDEVVWAIPFDETTVDFTFDVTGEEEKPKLKNKKKHKSDGTLEVDQVIHKRKKTKKKTEELSEPETKEERRKNEAGSEKKKKKRSFDHTETSTMERTKPKENFVSQNNGNLKNSSSSSSEDEFEKKKKKRSFDHIETSTMERTKPKENYVSQNNGNLKNSSSSSSEDEFEKKKKKRSFDHTETSTMERKQPKEKFVSQNNGNLKNSSGCGDGSFTPHEQSITNVKSLVDTFENKSVSSCAKKNHSLINNAFEKRINIVKTIIVSNGKTDMLKDKNLEDSSVVHSNSSTDNLNSENNDTVIRDDSSITTSTTSNHDMYKPRKRKRTRRHKNKKNNIEKYDFLKKIDVSEFFNTSIGSTSTIKFKPLEQAPVHVRFDEESKVENNEIEMKTENEEQEKCEEKKYNSDVTTKPSPEKKEIANGKLNGDQIISLDEPFDEETFIKCVLQFPVISGIEPRIGDVIAFRILRISENYTPEISSWIVGKVLSYKNKEVTFDITHGQDQCVNPQGKFCLEEEEPEEQNNEFKCLWQNVIEPRCIYP